MRAALCVQALIGNAQPPHRTAADQMLPHDLFGVLRPYAPVPDGVGIHHYRGPVLALVQAAGFVDAHLRAQPGFAGELLQARVQRARSVAGAGGPRRIGGTRVEADKDVTFKGRQARNLFDSVDFRVMPRRQRLRTCGRFPQGNCMKAVHCGDRKPRAALWDAKTPATPSLDYSFGFAQGPSGAIIVTSLREAGSISSDS